ncbi:MAG: hypothetical protein GX345_07335 [Clostridiales bacterium]|nr:hypothetical protein [Clostridiales bacterium]
MGRIEDHVKNSFKTIPDSPDKEDLMHEIILNLNEKVADLMELGKNQEDAENKAIVDFGDIDDLKAVLAVHEEIISKEEESRRRLAGFGFALFGSFIIIALLFFADLLLLSKFIDIDFPWYIFPSLGVLFWPLAKFFSWLKHRK